MRLWLHSGGTFSESAEEVKLFLGDTKDVLFVPYAINDLDMYITKVREVMGPWGFDVVSTHEAADAKTAEDSESFLQALIDCSIDFAV